MQCATTAPAALTTAHWIRSSEDVSTANAMAWKFNDRARRTGYGKFDLLCGHKGAFHLPLPGI